MIIPSKHSGYQAGIRLYPGGGGDGSGGDPSTGGEARGGMGFAGTGSGLAGTGAGAAQAGVGGGQTGYGLGNWASSSLASLMGTDSQGNARAGTNAGQTGGFDGGGSYQNSEGGGNTVVKKTQPTSTTAGTSTIDPNNPSLRAIGWAPYNQSGQYYNTLLQQGYAGNDIRNALTTQGKPISDSNYEALVQNAGMVSPTGRPMAGSDQFTQPVYNSQYQNYARPSTQFSTSLYGTQPMNSPAFNSGMSRRDINNTIGSFSKANPNADVSTTLDFMRNSGVNREDYQAYGGLNNYGPQMSAPSMQAQQSFNPYTNNQQPYNRFYGGQQQYNPFSYNEQSNSPPRSMGLPNPTNYNEQSNSPPQSMGLANPDSYQQPQSMGLANPTNFANQRFQQQQQFVQPQMNNPFSYQPQQQQQFRLGQSIEYPQQQQFNPYRQYEMSLGSYNPYEQQQQYSPFSYQQQQQYSPFSYQQQQYNPYDSYDSYPQTYQQQPVVPTSSGPSQAIYGRSSGARGTPNVMRRAEGGIAGILKK